MQTQFLLPPPLPKPATRIRLTLAQKADEARSFLSGATVPQVRRKFQCCARTAKYIKEKATDIVKSAETSPLALQHKTLRFVKYPDIEVRLYNFVQVARAARLPFTRLTLTARALSIKEKLLGSATDEKLRKRRSAFGASSTWLTNFVSRHALPSTHLHEDASSVRVSEVAADIDTQRYRLLQFRPEFIFNMDETGLFFQLFPKRTYVLPGEDRQ